MLDVVEPASDEEVSDDDGSDVEAAGGDEAGGEAGSEEVRSTGKEKSGAALHTYWLLLSHGLFRFGAQ